MPTLRWTDRLVLAVFPELPLHQESCPPTAFMEHLTFFIFLIARGSWLAHLLMGTLARQGHVPPSLVVDVAWLSCLIRTMHVAVPVCQLFCWLAHFVGWFSGRAVSLPFLGSWCHGGLVLIGALQGEQGIFLIIFLLQSLICSPCALDERGLDHMVPTWLARPHHAQVRRKLGHHAFHGGHSGIAATPACVAFRTAWLAARACCIASRSMTAAT